MSMNCIPTLKSCKKQECVLLPRISNIYYCLVLQPKKKDQEQLCSPPRLQNAVN